MGGGSGRGCLALRAASAARMYCSASSTSSLVTFAKSPQSQDCLLQGRIFAQLHAMRRHAAAVSGHPLVRYTVCNRCARNGTVPDTVLAQSTHVGRGRMTETACALRRCQRISRVCGRLRSGRCACAQRGYRCHGWHCGAKVCVPSERPDARKGTSHHGRLVQTLPRAGTDDEVVRV